MDNYINKYKYNPDDFSNYLSLREEMIALYDVVDKYHDSDDRELIQALAIIKLHQLHFTIKHRQLDSELSYEIAEELRDYFWSLVYD